MDTIYKKAIGISFLIFLVSIPLLKAEEAKVWPREITSEEGKITVFQPEIESFMDDKMECRAAIVVKMKEETAPVFGAIWYECRIATDRDNRTVSLLNINILADKFPNMDEDEIEKINSYVEQEVPQWEMVMSLDEILTGLEFNELVNSESENLNNEAPEIIFASSPTALIIIDGEPVWGEIEKTNFEYVVNTPFFIARETDSGTNYLKGGDLWYTSGNIYDGWEITDNIPQKLKNIESEQVVESDAESTTTSPAQIIIRTSPAELLLSNGSPQYLSVENTSLLFMTNTDEDIILDINTQEYYALVSGRWYKSQNLNSENWTFVSPEDLPTDFANIPENSPISSVRASISGTQEAKEAVLETRIPQTAEIDRESATLEVVYDGDPIFEEIEGTDILYAVNTDKEVLYIDNTYFCCDNAVWFESTAPVGPWIVSVEIPKEIMDIPPEYPVYNVKFVFIYDYTPEVVHSGYLQGYVNNYVYRGCVFYGTGYHYEPWCETYYYPRPLTYGFNAHYNTYSGWGFSYGTTFEGFKWINYDSRYHSKLNGYWGPSGYRHGYYRSTTLGKKRGFSDQKPAPPKNKNGKHSPENLLASNIATNNVYMKRKTGISRTGNYHFNPKTGKQLSGHPKSTKQAKTSTRSNNLYSDRTGNVYKRKNSGKWDPQKNHSNTNTRKKTSPKTNTSTAHKGTSTRKAGSSQKPTSQSATTRSSSTKRKITIDIKTQAKPTTTSKTTSGKRSSSAGQASSQHRTTSTSKTQNRSNTSNNLNRQYQSRTRSNQRAQNFNKNKTQNKYTQPGKSTTRTQTTPAKKSSGQSRSSSRPAAPANKKRK